MLMSEKEYGQRITLIEEIHNYNALPHSKNEQISTLEVKYWCLCEDFFEGLREVRFEVIRMFEPDR